MNNVIIVPNILAVASVVFSIAALYFCYKATKLANMHLFNGLNLGLVLVLVRRLLDYGITLHIFNNSAYTIRYIELTYFPLVFSVFMILGFMRGYSTRKALLIAKGRE